MTQFGLFQPVRELDQTGRSTVWLATRHGEPPDTHFIIKSVRPRPGRGSGADPVEQFLDQATMQQKLAEGGARHWAPIHEVSRTQDGAYYAMDKYTRSVRKLLVGKARLSPTSLHALVCGIVEGLVELEREFDRGHGNLKPHNVLLQESPDSPQPQVRLTDPRPSAQVNSQTFRGDLRALGELIYNLITHQRFRPNLWPLQAGKPWAHLGKNAEAWRNLCNELLNPNLDQAQLTLRQIADEELPKLVPHPPLVTPTRITAVTVLVIAIVIAAVLSRPEPKVIPFNPENWERLCYEGPNWFLPLEEKFDGTTVQGWPKDDADLQPILAQLKHIDIEKIECNASDIANQVGDIKGLASNPPSGAKDPTAIAETEAALQAIDKLRDRFEAWPLPDEIDKVAETFGQWVTTTPPPGNAELTQLFTAVADYLSRLANQARVPATMKQEADLVEGVARVYSEFIPLREPGGALERIHEGYDLLGLGQPITVAPGDPKEITNRFREFSGQFLVQAAMPGQQIDHHTLSDLGQRMADLITLTPTIAGAGDLVNEIRKEIAWQLEHLGHNPQTESFKQELSKRINERYQSVLNHCLAQDDLRPLNQLCNEWPARLRSFLDTEVAQLPDQEPSSPDPRTIWKPSKDALVDRIDDYLRLLNEFPGQQDTEKITQDFDAVTQESNEIAALPWTMRYELKVNSGIESTQQHLTAIEREAQQLLAHLRQPLGSPDPRLALAEDLDNARRAVDALWSLSPDHSQRFAEELIALQQLYEQVQTLDWVTGHETSIVSAVGGIRPRLDGLRQRVFEASDPRLYWDWKQRVDKITEGVEGLIDTARKQSVEQQLQEVTQQIQQAMALDWNEPKRWLIEQTLAQLNQSLDEIADLADVDPRKLYDAKWQDLILRSQQSLTFLSELTDPQLPQHRDQLQQIQARIQQLTRLPWPDEPEEKSAIQRDVREIDAQVNQLFESLDPRPAWLDEQRRIEKEIETEIGFLESQADPDAAGYQTTLQALIQRRRELGDPTKHEWDPQQQPGIVQDIKALRQEISALRQSVIRDPRQQIEWDRIISRIRAEVDPSAPGQNPTPAALTASVGSATQQIRQLRDAAWDPSRRDQIQDQVDQGLQELRALYSQALRANEQIEGVSSNAVNAQWRTSRDELLDKNPAMTLLELQDTVDRLRGTLIEMTHRLPKGLPDRARPRGWDAQRATSLISAAREEVFTQMMRSFRFDPQADSPFVGDETWRDSIEAFVAWHHQIGLMMDQFRSIELALDNGYGLEDTVEAQSRNIRDLAGYWRQQPLTHPFDVEDVFEPIIDRIDRLIEIDSDLDRSRLLALAQEAVEASDRSVAIAAWRKLGTLTDPRWPSSIAQLDDERAISQWLEGEEFQDIAQKQRLQEELDREKYRRWVSCVAALSRREQIDAAVQRFNQSKMQLQRVQEPWARYNIQLSSFRTQMATANPAAPDPQLREKMGAFIAASRALLPQLNQGQAQIEAFVAELEDLLNNEPASQDQAADLSKVGPRSSPVWDDNSWNETVSQDQRQIDYQWSKGKKQHKLTFLKVESASGSFYLCTTEVSVDLFRDMIDKAGYWPLFKALLGVGDPLWKGPKVWEPTRDGNEIKRNSAWTDTNPMLESSKGRHPDHFDDYDPGKPLAQHPMQYVSPQAAYGFAQLMGCRFATTAQWREAMRLELNGESLESFITQNVPNLRDTTWVRQFDHVRDLIQDRVMVESLLAPYSGSLWNQQDQDAWPHDDQTLWFETVDSRPARPFQHLIGNVAEFVFDGPQEPIDFNQAPAAVQAELRRSLDASRLSAIGGSAQSPRASGIDQPQAVETADASSGYSDVGVRLAFPTPREPLLVKLRRLLDQQSYLATDSSPDRGS